MLKKSVPTGGLEPGAVLEDVEFGLGYYIDGILDYSERTTAKLRFAEPTSEKLTADRPIAELQDVESYG